MKKICFDTFVQNPKYTPTPSPICLGTQVLLYKSTVMRKRREDQLPPISTEAPTNSNSPESRTGKQV